MRRERDDVRLVADRFAVNTDGGAIDLATGGAVHLSIATAADVADERRWTLRCDELHRLRHPALAPLVDYGTLGTSQHFEAWSCGDTWRGAEDQARRVVSVASSFLRALGLTVGDESRVAVNHGRFGAVVVLSAEAGHSPGSGFSGVGDVSPPGLAIVDRPAITALSEMCHLVCERQPRVATLWGPDGAGLGTAVLLLARSARMQGFVPIDSRLLDDHRALVAHRSLFVIDRQARQGRLMPWLRSMLGSSRSQVCLLTGQTEVRGVDGMPIGRVTRDTLVAAVRPTPISPSVVRRLERAAERADGLPGRFARLLWPTPFAERDARPIALHVAEQPATYGSEATSAAADDVAAASIAAVEPSRSWPSPGELARLRHQIESAGTLIASGRHAPGLRLLRQTIGGLARRDAWLDAGQAGVTLAAAQIARGRPRDALRTLEQARDHAARCEDQPLLLDVALATGDAWTDLARLDEGERAFRGALVAARSAGDRWRAFAATTGLARALFWRGDYADASAVLAGDATPSSSADASVRRLRLAARVAIALGATTDAMSALAEARARATPQASDRLVFDVEHTEAFVRLAIGDLDGAERHLVACVSGALRGRQRMRLLSARLMQAEVARRRGITPPAGALESLRRLVAAAPPLLKARWDVTSMLTTYPEEPQRADEHAAASGLRALILFVRPSVAPTAERPATDPFVDEAVAILRVCQHADDELALLREVCVRVRRQLRAAAVAFVAGRDGHLETLVTDGPRMETDVADRAIAAMQTIAPHRVRERLDAAAAVIYGGASVGALCARWTIGTTDDLSRAAAVLSMAATAAAPVLAALLVRRAQAMPSVGRELLGVTPIIADLRRTVERAAAAPFAVLIVGESGSGKELVARAIHRGSPRRDRPFCTLNCAALPDDLVEAELFGHARGAFTGAVTERPGVFEDAHGGTLFLDEIGELSARAQAKILRVIQEGELRRIGENASRRVDVRIVSATNRDLRHEVEAGRFRLDLSYRLDVIRIPVAPLRDRRDDIPLLVDHFWLDATRRVGSHATLASSTRVALASYDWPGNVRELQNVLASLAVRSPKRGVLPPSALPPQFAPAKRGAGNCRLDTARRTFEEAFVRAALVRTGGHRGRAAADLGVTRQGLSKLLTRLGIGP